VPPAPHSVKEKVIQTRQTAKEKKKRGGQKAGRAATAGKGGNCFLKEKGRKYRDLRRGRIQF